MKKVLLLMLLLVASLAVAEEVADVEGDHAEDDHGDAGHEEEHSNVGYLILVFVAIVGGRYYLKSKSRK
tara:strand:- start:3301 stop:3507 length:207 start_codon:yes stop_codon:yes gene_type:complete